MPIKPNSEQLTAENQDLRTRLEKAEATLSEILSGESDALFVTGVGGAQLFTLKGADQSYRTLIENMSEGALTLTPDGLILYANRRFAGMLRMPLEKVIGSEIHHWFAPESQHALKTLLQKDTADNLREELNLEAADGTKVSVYLSVNRLLLDEIPGSIGMVVTDLTEQKRNDAILAEEKLARAILEQAADAIVICDENGRIIRASKQAQVFYGKSPVGQLFEQAFPLRQPDDTAFLSISDIDINRSLSVEVRLDCQGQECDLLASVGYLKGPRNELLGSVITLTDITERKQAVEHLKLFRALLDNSSDAIEVLDPVTLLILDVNETQCRALGYSREELLSMKIMDIDLALNADLLNVIEEQIRKTGAARFESVHRRKDGSTFPVEVSSKLIELDKPYALNIVRDITERKQAEEQIHMQAERLMTTLESITDAFFTVDREWRFTFLNREAERLLKRTCVELTGLDFWMEFPDTIGSTFEREYRRAMADNKAVGFEEFYPPLNTWFDVRAYPSGQGLAVYFRDITETKRTMEEVNFKNTMLQTLQEFSLDAILVVDENGKINSFNQKFIDLWQVSPQIVSAGQDAPVLQVVADQVENSEAFVTRVNYLYEHRDEKSHEELLLKDGRIIDRNSASTIGADGKYYGRVWYFRDITERKQSEDKLAANESLLREFIRYTPAAIAMLDTQMRYIQTSERWMQDYKVVDQDIVGKSHYTIFPEIGQNWKDIHQRVLAGAIERCDEDAFPRADGSTDWMQWEARPWYKSKDKIGGIIFFTQVITERKQAEEALRKRTQQLEEAQKIGHIGNWEWVVASNSSTWSREMYSIFDHDPGIFEFTLENFLAAPHPDDRAMVQEIVKRSLENIEPSDFEFRIITSSGEIRWIHEISQISLDSTGKLDRVYGTCQDITENKRAEEALRVSEQKFHAVFDHSNDGIMAMDIDKKTVKFVNVGMERMLGYGPGELFGFELSRLHPPEVLPQVGAQFEKYLSGDKSMVLDIPMLTRDGRVLYADINGSTFNIGDQHYLLGAFRDATERRNTEARIKYLNRVLSVLSGINSLIVRVNDRDELFREACNIAVDKGGFRMSMVVIVNPGAKRVVSIASAGKDEELLTMIKGRLLSSVDVSNTMVGQAISGKQTIVSNDSLNDPRVVFGKQYAESGVRSMAILPLIVADEAVGTIALYASEIEFFHEEEMKLLTELAGDISFAIDHIDKQEKLNYLAYYDVLTGLANRTLFFERVTQYMRSATNGGHQLAIGLIDLERFKNINDSLGRATGDALLKQVAEWLTYKTGDANLLARIDADHFALVMPEIRQDGDLAKLIENTMEAFLQHPFRLNDVEFRISVKVGIALFPDDGTDAEALFRNAEAALKRAKSDGDRFLFYTQQMTEAVAGKLTLENQLRQAIDNEEFVLYYQPKVNMVSGKVTSTEALIRWNDPRTGLVPPGKFIPILEETGLIYEVGRWALRQAIADYLRWRAMGLPAVRIAVNVSPLQLRNTNFMSEIRHVISLGAHAAEGLELEITESLIMEDVQYSIDTLKAIRAMGITFAIDDFGTGFSSLSYLAKLPVDTLKIDRSFVIEMDAPEGLALVSTIILVAHALKLKVVAEGVETEQQSRQLLSLGCDEMQGFLFSKPVPAEIFEARFLAPLWPDEKQ